MNKFFSVVGVAIVGAATSMDPSWTNWAVAMVGCAIVYVTGCVAGAE